ncbi:MAG: CZB domain-containing protein [Proteobacteria bacterium]|nr:CZB domain-containing protein [Pseudomonadota bacterium]
MGIANIKIQTKLIVIACTTSAMFLFLGTILIRDISQINKHYQTKDQLNLLSREMMQLEIDHLKWAQHVAEFLSNPDLKHLDVEKNFHLCGFGKWYYGTGKNEAVLLLPALKELTEKIEAPHRDLHESAIILEDTLAKGENNYEVAVSHFENKTKKYLADVQKMLAEIRQIADEKYTETEQQARQKTKMIYSSAIFWVILFTIAIIVMILLLSGSITRSIKAVNLLLKEIAQGESDLTKRLPMGKINCSAAKKCGHKDCPEFGKESSCWDTVGSNAPGEIHCPTILSGKLKSCNECLVMQSVIRTEMDELSAWFNTFIGRISHIIKQDKNNVDILLNASEELSSTATELSATTEEMSAQSNAIAASAEQSSVNMNHIATSSDHMSMAIGNVAASIEEMTATINEIAKNCQNESDISERANDKARTTTESIALLAQAFKNIENVVSIINDIADQTNLLALNATIEAARAGDAGKGFAVVANEVKELAKQTGQATKEISGQIEAVRKSMSEAIGATSEVGKSIEDVNMISQMIVSAVDEIGITVNEIAKNISSASDAANAVSENIKESSQGIAEISNTIAGLSQAAGETANGASQIEQGAARLSQLANKLYENVEQFRV